MSLFSELHRRNVVRVGIAYAVTAWLLLQVADVVMENIGAPPWVMQALLFVLVIGIVPALLFAWVFELTPQGLKRESEIAAGESVVHQTRRKLDTLIIVLLVGVVAYFVWDTRFQNAPDGDVTAAAGDSDRAAPADYAPTEKSIAVLPFVNLSSDPEQDYFSDGISEELLNVLAQIPQLRVAARTSSFQFKGDNRDIGEIADLLNVDHVLEGSVRKAGKRLRITAQLIEAEQGFHLWSNTYDRELSDVFAIQDEISQAIADALRAELALDTGAMTAAHVAETSNAAAYEAFLKGRALVNKRGNINITEAVRELEKSVRLDPDYAPARAQLAIAIALLTNSSGTYGDLPLIEVNERAGEQLRIAERLDPDIAEVWAAKTVLATVNNREAEVVEYADRALAIRPNYVDPLNWKINSLGTLGRFAETQATREYLLEIDPLSVIGRLNAVSSISVSEPERAKRIAASIAPQSAWASHTAFAQIYSQTGEPLEELENLLAAYAIDAQDLLINYRLLALFATFGLDEEALRIERDLRAWALLEIGLYEDAEAELRKLVAEDPESLELRTGLADVLYYQRRFAEAVEVWHGTMIDTQQGRVVYSNGGSGPSLRLLHALLEVGDSGAAAELQETLEKTFRSYAEAVGKNAGWYFYRGALASLAGDTATAAAFWQQSVAGGWYYPKAFDDPAFDTLQGDPAFETARGAATATHAAHRRDILRLICDNNPVPDHWRPLDSSCSGR